MQSRLRPPLSKPVDNSFFDLSGVTADESSDYPMKSKYFDAHRPHTPASGLDDNDSVFDKREMYRADSRLEPSHRGSIENLFDDKPKKPFMPYGPPRLENEIQNIPTRPLQIDSSYKNPVYDDLRSLDRSQLANPQPGGVGKPRPPLASAAAAQAYPRSQIDSSISYQPTPQKPTQMLDVPTPTQRGLNKRSPVSSTSSREERKPRPPLANYQSPLMQNPYQQPIDDTVDSPYSSMSQVGGYQPKSRPPLAKPRPPIGSQPGGKKQQRAPLYPGSRETLNTSTSSRSIENLPKPKETDM
jgi:hypothetical protein